ncbi:lasso peptide biosynthesis PqqD family chaperone [Streptomyces smyrnaeus]|uniref:lasso peptide biosynthesis PqqD family chaperone n=1 Tax=Streptomyces TaxID=1883 RepID=UPI00161344E5|nr:MULTISPECIES: lasso peptide biosynthesis PqqD family chaperone [unclassified Streptomyces]MBQ0867274.1 lasso peptide biosynthesis PqqD family chaperone [Streptomyces sp. RK75]MBQ1119816.1 lasso peptide biosynthesis PqqD family chaperone [Streptomyces sp. B15]MBQ1156867.1 lasso peptide biosynthesis PqqD family chaperone [Streptomyces sp. A73]
MTLALPREVILTETESGVVLLNEKDGRFWRLNDSGATALRLLLEGRTPREAAEELSAAGPQFLERATADVHGLVDALRSAGLLIAEAP